MECERAAAETGGQGGLQTASPRFKSSRMIVYIIFNILMCCKQALLLTA